jgi:phosphatidylglycerophosphatase A
MNAKHQQPAIKPWCLLRQHPWRLDFWCALGLGTGLSPIAPGTVGTVLGVFGYCLLMPLGFKWFLIVTAFSCLVGVWLCHMTAVALGVHDHKAIVWDEVVGYWVTMAWLPNQWWWMAIGFCLFRFFDITKPFPIRWVDQHCPGGWGIMFDDVLAGLIAGVLGHLLLSLTVFS